jgi:hypothetical protein
VGKVKKSGELTDVRRTTVSNRSSQKAAPPKASPARREAGASKPARAAKARAKAPAKSPKRAASPAAQKKVRAKPLAKRVTRSVARRPAVVKQAVKRAGKKAVKKAVRGTRKAAAPVKREPQVHVRIRELDPVEKCGPGTSVERLIRVDEIVDRVIQAHLVFLDHHGWYCEHGQSCKAVGHARKHAQHVRSQFVGNGTHNGRMRA